MNEARSSRPVIDGDAAAALMEPLTDLVIRAGSGHSRRQPHRDADRRQGGLIRRIATRFRRLDDRPLSRAIRAEPAGRHPARLAQTPQQRAVSPPGWRRACGGTTACERSSPSSRRRRSPLPLWCAPRESGRTRQCAHRRPPRTFPSEPSPPGLRSIRGSSPFRRPSACLERSHARIPSQLVSSKRRTRGGEQSLDAPSATPRRGAYL